MKQASSSSSLETHQKAGRLATFKPHYIIGFPSVMFKSKAKPKKTLKTMEETFSLILHGCKLAQDFETNLGNLANQPGILFMSCDNIVKIFATAKERLNNAQDPALFTHLLRRPQNSSQQQQLTDPSLQEWPKNYGFFTQAMDVTQQQLAAGKTPSEINEMGGKIQAMDLSDFGRGSPSSSQPPRRSSSRKNDGEKCIMRVAAPEMGNTDVPPEDNYTWRKYGQKQILGSSYPRAYYRCTYRKMYNCPAKKQVQRLDNDFYTFEVTYIGQHSCHISSMASSIPPPPPPPPLQITQHQMMSQASRTPTSSSSSVLPLWLSMDFSLGSGSGSGGSGIGGPTGGSSTTTASRYGRDVNVDFPAVADMVDVMFNSSSSSSTNTMDFIFPFVEDKWEAGERDRKI